MPWTKGQRGDRFSCLPARFVGPCCILYSARLKRAQTVALSPRFVPFQTVQSISQRRADTRACRNAPNERDRSGMEASSGSSPPPGISSAHVAPVVEAGRLSGSREGDKIGGGRAVLSDHFSEGRVMTRRIGVSVLVVGACLLAYGLWRGDRSATAPVAAASAAPARPEANRTGAALPARVGQLES